MYCKRWVLQDGDKLSRRYHLTQQFKPFASNWNILPPGRLMLDTSPAATGSTPVTKMMGMVSVAFFAASAASRLATIAATLRVTSSAASFGNRSVWPFAQRVSITTLSFVYPDSRKPWRTAATRCPDSPARFGLRNPTTGNADCCAFPASGHAAAAPPTNAMNSRRLMASPPPRTTSGYQKTITFLDRELRRSLHASGRPHVRFGSLADIETGQPDVRFTSKSRHH